MKTRFEIWLIHVAIWILRERRAARNGLTSLTDHNEMLTLAQALDGIARRMQEQRKGR